MLDSIQNGQIGCLKGKTFISTRPIGKSDELNTLIGQNGGELVEFPMIEIVSAQLDKGDIEQLKNLDRFDWLIFTSSNGVTCFFDSLKKATGSYQMPSSINIAVLSSKIAETLKLFGANATLVNSGSTADDFLLDLRAACDGKHSKALLAFGNLARETIEIGLKSIANITRLNVYDTVSPKSVDKVLLDRIFSDDYEMIIFTSPSGFQNFSDLVDGKLNISLLRAASIGTTTTSALNEKGLIPLVTATTMNSSGIAEAILDYYKR